MKILMSGLDVIAFSLQNLGNIVVRVFKENIGLAFMEQMSRIKKEDIVKLLENRLLFYSKSEDEEKIPIYILSADVLSKFIKQFNERFFVMINKPMVIIYVDNETTEYDVRWDLDAFNQIILEPAFLFEIPIYIREALSIAVKCKKCVFIHLTKSLLHTFEEVDTDFLKMEMVEGHSGELDKCKKVRELITGINHIKRAKSPYIAVVAGSVYRDFLSVFFDRNLLDDLTIFRLGAISPQLIDQIVENVKDKSYLIVIDLSEFLRRKLERELLSLYFIGKLESMPIIADEDNIALIPDDQLYVALKAVFEKIKMLKKLSEGLEEHNIAKVYPKPPNLVSLFRVLTAMKDVLQNVVFIVYSSKSVFNAIKNIESEIIFCESLRELLSIMPNFATIGEKKIILIVHNRDLDFLADELYYFNRMTKKTDGVIILGHIDQRDIAEILGTYTSMILKIDTLESLRKFIANIKEIFEEPSVIIIEPEYDFASGLTKVWIDNRYCVRCNLCVEKTGCPAIGRLMDGSLFIDDALCTVCGICIDTCPYSAILYQ